MARTDYHASFHKVDLLKLQDRVLWVSSSGVTADGNGVKIFVRCCANKSVFLLVISVPVLIVIYL